MTTIADLERLGLSKAEVEARRTYVGVSDLNYICGDNEEYLYNLWAVKTGRQEPEDLSDKIPVILGSFTEPFNLALFQKSMGIKIASTDTHVTHPDIEWLKARPDGVTVGGYPVECKHVGAFDYDTDKIVDRYLPQLTGQMLCMGVTQCYISIIVGNQKHEVVAVDLDDFYAAEVVAAASQFWSCVQRDELPEGIHPPDKPIPPELLKTIDLTTSNVAMDAEATMVMTADGYDAYRKAEKQFRECITKDVGLATGRYYMAKRDKRGALRISKRKD